MGQRAPLCTDQCVQWPGVSSLPQRAGTIQRTVRYSFLLHGSDKLPDKNSLKKEKVNFGSQFQGLQSMAFWPCTLGLNVTLVRAFFTSYSAGSRKA